MLLKDVGHLSWLWSGVRIDTESPTFRFRDTIWRITLLRNDYDILHLDLNSDSSYSRCTIDTPLNVSVQVEDSTGRFYSDLGDRTDGLDSNGGCIWWRWEKDIERVYPSFQRNFVLTFRITIEEINPQIGTSTRCSPSDASTQTECPTYNTVNSFISNYFPVNSTATNSETADSSKASSNASSSNTQSLLSTSTSPCLVSLVEDFTKLLDEESYPDVEFHCEDFSTKAHRNVVSTRSPVLARMLKSDMVEGKTGIVEIKDMDADTFKQLFRYLYSGKLDELTFDKAIPLYEAADQYAVHALTSRCSEFITKNLSEDNAYDVLIVADAHSDFKFVEVVVEYMVKHMFPMSSDRWSKFSDDQPRLANKVLNQFCKMWAGNVLKC